jgi:hypothetical protein
VSWAANPVVVTVVVVKVVVGAVGWLLGSMVEFEKVLS